ncbi:hypothetical protein C3V41_11745 [Actinomyces sp. oral taxon 897]|nr:hypothetical protein C3V41_11745 [Actinomyces sp. oral taxon 897]
MGSAVISVLAGLFMVAVCVFVVVYSVLFGTSVTWFDRDGAHVFYLLQPVVVVPWEAILAEGSLQQEDFMDSAEGSMPFVFVTVNGIPWPWLPGFARLGVWARSWGPLMRRMRRVLRWADWAGYLEEARCHLGDDPDTRKEERCIWYRPSPLASRRSRAYWSGRRVTWPGPEDDTP